MRRPNALDPHLRDITNVLEACREICIAFCTRSVRSTPQLIQLAMLWIVIFALLVFWGVGFFAELAGDLIHILLVIALIILVYNLVV